MDGPAVHAPPVHVESTVRDEADDFERAVSVIPDRSLAVPFGSDLWLDGILGLLIGAGGSYAASRMLGIPFTLPPMAALLAVIVSVVVGVVFGVFPARKAAHLHPIEALRFE